MNNVRIILLNNDQMSFRPIGYGIEDNKISEDVIALRFAEEALKAVPASGKAIVVTESIIMSEKSHEKIDGPTRQFAEECRKKNPDCKIILYTVEPFDLTADMFDSYIPSSPTDSYEQLLNTIKEYAEQ